MAAPTNAAFVKKSLANSEPSRADAPAVVLAFSARALCWNALRRHKCPTSGMRNSVIRNGERCSGARTPRRVRGTRYSVTDIQPLGRNGVAVVVPLRMSSVASLPATASATIRSMLAFTYGQRLQIKTTSVLFCPRTSESVQLFPSTPWSAKSGAGKPNSQRWWMPLPMASTSSRASTRNVIVRR